MRELVIYTPNESPRLHYVLNWVFVEVLGQRFRLTSDFSEGADISYGGTHSTQTIHIPAGGLLFRLGAEAGEAPPAAFSGAEPGFDVLGEIFRLLSRMEEWLPFSPDRHGRFPASQSTLFKAGLLREPIVDIWIESLRLAINERCGFSILKPPYSFHPTYDIDIAWAYQHKGFKRNVGGLLRDVKQRNVSAVRARLRTLQGLAPDPYAAYRFLRQLHAETGLLPQYFMLAAAKTGPFDKNAPRDHAGMHALLRDFVIEGTVGIHPSYSSSESPALIADEKAWMEEVAGKPADQSRQHYIRLRIPQNYRALLDAGIAEDWSMGYPDALGYRAGTGRSFLWYDLEREETTRLRVHPFCFMDVTARDYEQLTVPDSFALLSGMRKTARLLGTPITTVFHNFSLGTAPDWLGWREAYRAFVTEGGLIP